VLERAPVRLQYWFSEDLEPEFSSITVRDQVGNVVATGGVSPDDSSLMEARLPTNLPDGAYVNELRVAFASDGHVIVESRVFFVGEAVGGITGLAASDQAVVLEVVWRVLVLASMTLLLGAFALYNLVLLPSWGSDDYPVGHLPPRVMNRLNWIVIVALVIAFGGNLLALQQQTMVFFGADAGRVLSEGLWQVVRIGTRFGDTWNIRMLLLTLVAVLHSASLYLRQQQPETVRAFWAANLWVVALCVGTLSIASHAAGSLLLPWVGILSDWLHALAAGFWVGGVATLALVLPVALRPYMGAARRWALLAVLNRFSPIAVACVVVVIATGVYSASNWLHVPTDLATTYGGTLALKVLLVGLLLAVGAVHFIALRPERYARWMALIAHVRGFIPTLRFETALALFVLIAAAYLSATPVPKPELQSPPPPSATQSVDEYTVTTIITPGGPGVNTYDTVVMRNGQPVNDATVYVRLTNPAQDWRGAWQAAETVGDGLYVYAGAEIDRPGEWLTLVEIEEGDAVHRAVFAWDITADAAVIEASAPNWINMAAIIGVLSAVGFAVYPLARRAYRMLDLSPANVTVAVGAVGLTVIIVVVGVIAAQGVTHQYETTVNPPPLVVNTVLPDSESLARGRALLMEACGDWQAATDWNELLSRLPRLRDEVLFAYTRDGWRTLPSCTASLSDVQRWDIVNYVRSWETIDG
jgi:putative copper export protein